jgi:cytochrome c2
MEEDAQLHELAIRPAPGSGARCSMPLPARGYPLWTEAALDAFLRSLEESAPGTAMTFIDLPAAKERLMAYLAATRDGLGRE